jgi:hypothetical protein
MENQSQLSKCSLKAVELVSEAGGDTHEGSLGLSPQRHGTLISWQQVLR